MGLDPKGRWACETERRHRCAEDEEGKAGTASYANAWSYLRES